MIIKGKTEKEAKRRLERRIARAEANDSTFLFCVSLS